MVLRIISGIQNCQKDVKLKKILILISTRTKKVRGDTLKILYIALFIPCCSPLARHLLYFDWLVHYHMGPVLLFIALY